MTEQKNNKSETIINNFKNWASHHPILIAIVVLIVLGYIVIQISGNPTGSSISNTSTNNTLCSGDISGLKGEAQKINFSELDKNPESFKGTAAKFTGQVVQIQESGNQGFMRLAVTKESYGWSIGDIIFVDYQQQTNFVKDDVVTVYGFITGAKTYTSQANFQITIPNMTACILEKGTPETSPQNNQPTSKGSTAPVPSTSSVPKTWHTVTSFSGVGEKNTEPFTIKGSQWRINWTANANDSYCITYGCGFYIYVYSIDKRYSIDSTHSDISGTKSDTSYFYKNGTFYLNPSGSTIDSWLITVEDYY